MKSTGLWLQTGAGLALIATGTALLQLYAAARPLMHPGAYPEGAPPGFHQAMSMAPLLCAALIIAGIIEAGLALWLIRLSPTQRAGSRLYRSNMILHLAQPPVGTLIGALLMLEHRPAPEKDEHIH